MINDDSVGLHPRLPGHSKREDAVMLKCEDCYHLGEVADDLDDLREGLRTKTPPNDRDLALWSGQLTRAIRELRLRHKAERQAEIEQREAAGDYDWGDGLLEAGREIPS